MASNDKKQEARAKRQAAEQAAAAKAKRNKQLQIFAGVVFAALVVVVLIVVIGGSGKSGNETTAGTQVGTPEAVEQGDVAGVQETKDMLAGLPQNGLTLGEKDAPVQIIEFVDLQCPFCKDHQLDVQPKIINDVVKTGKAKITLAPIAFLGPDSTDGRVVLARMAGKDKAWDFVNLWYWNQGNEGTGYATDAYIKGLLAKIPGTSAADVDREPDAEITKRLDEVDTWQKDLKVSSTPTFYVGKTGTDPATFEQVDAGGPDASSAIIDKVNELSGQGQ